MSAFDEIAAKARELNLGSPHPDSPEPRPTPPPRSEGYWQRFEHATVYWSPASGAHAVWGAISGKYGELGWEQGLLGFPITDELPTPDGLGRFNHFEGGSIYWTAETGAHEVHGAIRNKWAELGWERGFGYPLTDELPTPNGTGRFNHFQYASIYWTPTTGAHEAHGAIRDKWAELGWELGLLGYPLTDELATPDGVGRFNHFEGGSIYWTPATDAHEVHGAIRNKWADLGWELSFLGYPLTDERVTPDRIGRYNHFEGGAIYWSPATAAHEVHGDIRARWAVLGWERSRLGYPVTDETPTPTGLCRFNNFQRGSIYWSAATGARETRSVIRLHVKILTTPTIPVDQMLDAMQQVYLTAGIRAEVLTTETLNLPVLNDLDVGTCTGGTTTAEQNQLFGNRNNVGRNHVVIYFVRSTVPPLNGCAAHPDGRPGVVVAQGATQWTLAHEVGHVLGLNHVDNNNHLMTGNGTGNITNPPPDLTAGEINTMDDSRLTVNL